jgi:hypothetical protein
LAAFANSKESSFSRELEVTAASFQLLQGEITVWGLRFGISGLTAEERNTFFLISDVAENALGRSKISHVFQGCSA